MTEETPITILIAEDQAMTRFGLKCALEAYPDIKVVAECADGTAAVLQALAVKADVILMDIGLPKLDGIMATKQIKQALPDSHIIIFTALESDENVYGALHAGADAYCLKSVSSEDLYTAIKAVRKGVAWLDPGIADRVLRSVHAKQEAVVSNVQTSDKCGETLNEKNLMILKLLSEGADLEQVARQFNLAPESVSRMVNQMIAKLNGAAAHTPRNLTFDLVEGEERILADKYLLEAVLGRGGMGIVFKGKHLLMEKPVAIKMLLPEFAEDEVVAKRFHSEAKSLCNFSHPNLVSVFDFGITPTKEPYMVMDLHQGKSLEDILGSDEKPDLQTALEIFGQVCDALSAVHERNIVHRDIKPGNILISEEGLVKLVDFGIAESVHSKNMNLTMAGEVIGTPRYMSPEQCKGKEMDARSDVYSLGCVMYEVFTGRPPFDADSFYEMVRHHVEHLPPRLPFGKPGINVPKELQAIILVALQKDPGRRQQTAAQLKHQLMAVADLVSAGSSRSVVAHS